MIDNVAARSVRHKNVVARFIGQHDKSCNYYAMFNDIDLPDKSGNYTLMFNNVNPFVYGNVVARSVKHKNVVARSVKHKNVVARFIGLWV
jgi:hypothetical protein